MNKDQKKFLPKVRNMEYHSSQSFNKRELNLLNNGINIGIKDSWEEIAPVESALQYMPNFLKVLQEIIKNKLSGKTINDKVLNQVEKGTLPT